MDLNEILEEKRSSILKAWFNRTISSYPEDTKQFLRRQRDAMANPVGAGFRDGLERVLDCLIRQASQDEFKKVLDKMVRIRAVQNFSPSQALAFIPEIKGIVHEAVASAAKGQDLSRELASFDSAVDTVLLWAMDCYAACRQDLSEIRIKDEQRRIHMLLRRANMLVEQDGSDLDLPDLREGGQQDQNQER